MAEILKQAIGADRASLEMALSGSLQNFIKTIDLCLMYDAPTNAVIDFLRIGLPILNPIPAPLGNSEAATANSQVVPRASVEATLETLDAFIADGNSLDIFCRKQFSEYVSLFKESYALRRFM